MKDVMDDLMIRTEVVGSEMHEGKILIPNSLFDFGMSIYQSRIYLCLLQAVALSPVADTAIISYSIMADKTGISMRKVKSTIQELEQLGVVSITKRTSEDGGHMENEYTLYMPEVIDRLKQV